MRDHNTGELWVGRRLTEYWRLPAPVVELWVSASDDGVPPLSAAVAVAVSVQPVNSVAPRFVQVTVACKIRGVCDISSPCVLFSLNLTENVKIVSICHCTGIAICSERDADLHMAQLMPLPLTRAYSKRVPRTNCALRIKKCAPRIFSGIYFLSTS